MRRLLKFCFFLLLLAGLAAAAGFLWLRSWLPSEAGASYLSAKATEALQRPVTLRGLTLPGGVALDVAEVSVGPADPARDPRLTLATVHVALDLGASWSLGKPVLSELTVGGGEAHLATGEPPAAAPAPRQAPGPAPSTPSPTPVPGARDRGLPLLARLVRLGEFRVQRGEGPPLLILEELQASLDAQGKLAAEARGQTVGDGNFTLEAEVALGGSSPQGHASLAGAGVAVDGLLAAASAFTDLPPGVHGTGILNFDARWKRQGDQEELAAKVLPQGLEVHHPSLRQPLRIPHGNFHITPQELEVDVPLEVGALRATAKGHWKPPTPEGAVDLALEVARFGVGEIGPLLPPALEAQVAGRGRGDIEVTARIAGTGAAPDWKVAVVPHGLRLVATGDLPEVEVSGAGLNATPTEAQLDVKLRAGPIDLSVGAALEPPSPAGALDLLVRGEALPAAALASLAGGLPGGLDAVHGSLDLEASFQGPAMDIGPSAPGLTVVLKTHELGAQVAALGGSVAMLEPRVVSWKKGVVPAFPLAVRTPMGTLEGTVTPQLAASPPGATITWSVPALRLGALVPGMPAGTLQVSGHTQVTGGAAPVVVAKDLKAAGSLEVGGAPQALRATVASLRLQGGAVVVEDAVLEGPGVRASGGVRFPPGENPKLTAKAMVELAKLPVALPDGLTVTGRVHGALSHQGPLASLSEQVLPLRFEGVALAGPGLPRISWKSGDLRVSSAGAQVAGARIGLGPELEVQLTGGVDPSRTKASVEFADWTPAQLAALAGAVLPEGVDFGGTLAGRLFYQGALPSGLPSLAEGLAVRLMPKDLFARIARDGAPPVVLRLGNQDLVLKEGRFDLAQLAVGTPAGKVSLEGELLPFSGALPEEVAFSAPRLEGFGSLLAEGTKVTGFAALDGKLAPQPGGGFALEARLRPRQLRALAAGSETPLELRAGTILAYAKTGEDHGLRALLKGDDVEVLFGSLVRPVVWAGGSVRVAQGDGVLQDVELRLGQGTSLKLAGALAGRLFRGAGVRGVLDLKDIQPAFGIEASRQLVGKVDVAADLLGGLDDFQVKGSMRAPAGVAVVFLPQGGGKPFPIPLLDVSVPFSFQGTDFLLQEAKAKLYGGAFELDGRFHFDQEPFGMAQTIRLEGIQLAEFSSQSLAMPGAFSGTVSTVVSVTGKGTDPATLQLAGDVGRIQGFELHGEVLGTAFGLQQYLNPAEAAANRPGASWKDILKGIVVEKVVQKVDALAEYREHLRSLLSPHRYPELEFQIGAPQGVAGLVYVRVPKNPEMFSASASFNLSTLALQAYLNKMSFRYKDECRLHVRGVQVGGLVNAPVLQNPDFWKQIEKRCPPPPPPPAPVVPAPVPAPATPAPVPPAP